VASSVNSGSLLSYQPRVRRPSEVTSLYISTLSMSTARPMNESAPGSDGSRPPIAHSPTRMLASGGIGTGRPSW
jgi:hypothetical protein